METPFLFLNVSCQSHSCLVTKEGKRNTNVWKKGKRIRLFDVICLSRKVIVKLDRKPFFIRLFHSFRKVLQCTWKAFGRHWLTNQLRLGHRDGTSVVKGPERWPADCLKYQSSESCGTQAIGEDAGGRKARAGRFNTHKVTARSVLPSLLPPDRSKQMPPSLRVWYCWMSLFV